MDPHSSRGFTTFTNSGNVANQTGSQIVHGSIYIQPSQDDEANNQCLRDLRLTDPRDDMRRIESTKDSLLQDSCSWILDDPAFLDWWNGEGSGFLWIHGDPGKGKTMMTIALISSISERLADGALGVLSYFFCQNTVPELNRATSVLRGLIYLLISQHGNLVHHLRKPYDEAGSRLFEGLNALSTLWRILSNILQEKSLPTVYLIVDALDECDNDILRILEWIDASSQPRVKWLVTSRNEPQIKEPLESNGRPHTSLELNSSHVAKAVDTFIDTKVNELARQKKYGSELQLFIKDYLLCNADGTFLWVALICKELKGVSLVRTKSTLQRFPTGLQSLYKQMMERVERAGEDTDLCKKLLCSATLACRPLSLKELATFAPIPDQFQDEQFIEGLVDQCGSFLILRQKTAYFVHQSAKDYFSTGKGSYIFRAGQPYEHARIAILCLKLMLKVLKRNMCNLQTPGPTDEVQSSILDLGLPAEVQYACLYWVDHLKQAGQSQHNTINLRDDGPVHQFMKTHFLYWLEAMSLIKKVSDGVLAIMNLECILPSDVNSDLYAIVHDAKRFILNSSSIVEEAPLQVYISALVFSPRQSIIRNQYLNHFPTWIKHLPTVESNWSSSLQTLEGHNGWIRAVAFSPDGQLLASGSHDSTVRLWDSTTGAARDTLKGHTDSVQAVAFSLNGQLLASGSRDSTVRLWDSMTGATRRVLEGHTGWIEALTFSPDGQLLASGSRDSTVRLWDSTTGAVRGRLEGHIISVMAVTFSPDGQLLASGSNDCTVRLWDSTTGAVRGRLEGHTISVMAVTFSPDGQLLASGSRNSTVRLWDSTTGAVRGRLEGHTISVMAVTFSPDGQLLASSFNDCTVRLWNSTTRAARDTLKGHTDWVQAVAFHPNGKLLASGSVDCTVRLWDSTTRTVREGRLEGHTGSVQAVTFSPNGKLLASSSNDCTVRLWDSTTGAAQGTLKGHTGSVWAVTFSPDGQLLASGSTDCTVRLWNSTTGAAQGTLKGHIDSIRSVAFSPDSQLLASSSHNSTVRLWDLRTRTLFQQFDISNVVEISFSADGSYLQTNCGQIQLTSIPGNVQSQQRTFNSWLLNGNWLTWDNHKILWLPHHFRPRCLASHDSMFAMGYSSGRVIFLGLEPKFTFDHLQ